MRSLAAPSIVYKALDNMGGVSKTTGSAGFQPEHESRPRFIFGFSTAWFSSKNLLRL